MKPAIAVAVLAAVLTVAIAYSSAAAGEAPPLRAEPDCAAKLVATFACLPHVASPAGDAAPAPSAACCAAFSSATTGTSASEAPCLCHVVRDPLLFGFPLNTSRLLALFSSCGASGANATAEADSVVEICRVASIGPYNDTAAEAEAPGPSDASPSANLDRANEQSSIVPLLPLIVGSGSADWNASARKVLTACDGVISRIVLCAVLFAFPHIVVAHL